MTERITPRFGCGTPRKKDTMKFHTFSDATKFFDNLGTIDIILGGVCRRPRSGIGGRRDCKRRHNNDDNSPPPILGGVWQPRLHVGGSSSHSSPRSSSVEDPAMGRATEEEQQRWQPRCRHHLERWTSTVATAAGGFGGSGFGGSSFGGSGFWQRLWQQRPWRWRRLWSWWHLLRVQGWR